MINTCVCALYHVYVCVCLEDLFRFGVCDTARDFRKVAV